VVHKPPEFFGEVLESCSGPELRFNCPFCETKGKTEDTKYHLYFNEDSGLYFCQRCETGGHIDRLNRIRGGLEEIVPVRDREADLQRIRKILMGIPVEDPSKKPILTAPLPEDYVPITLLPDTAAEAYLLNRGITRDQIVQYRLGFGTGENRGRIIFPVFDPANKERCVFWVARSYMNTSHSKDCKCFACLAKYKNAPHVHRRYYLFGLDQVQGDEVCVAEGPISALCCGPNSVATLGKHVTSDQIEMLAKFKKVIVALDDDAVAQSHKLIQSLMRKGVEVYFIPFPKGQDPGDLGQAKMAELRKNAVRIDRFTHPAVLMWKQQLRK
jgi:DNA primase